MKKLLIISLMTLTIGIVASANSGKENIYNGKAKGFKGNIKIAADFEKIKLHLSIYLNTLKHLISEERHWRSWLYQASEKKYLK